MKKLMMLATIVVLLGGCGDRNKDDKEPRMSPAEMAEVFYSHLSGDEYMYLFGDVSGNYRPQVGTVYFYRDVRALQIQQVLDGAVLARCFSREGNPLLIYTNHTYVDNDWLKEGYYLCEGTVSYETISGANVTTYRFREITGETGLLLRAKVEKANHERELRLREEAERRAKAAAEEKAKRGVQLKKEFLERLDYSLSTHRGLKERMQELKGLWDEGFLAEDECKGYIENIRKAQKEELEEEERERAIECAEKAVFSSNLLPSTKKAQLKLLLDQKRITEDIYNQYLGKLEQMLRAQKQKVDDILSSSQTVEEKDAMLKALRARGELDYSEYLDAHDRLRRQH